MSSGSAAVMLQRQQQQPHQHSRAEVTARMTHVTPLQTASTRQHRATVHPAHDRGVLWYKKALPCSPLVIGAAVLLDDLRAAYPLVRQRPADDLRREARNQAVWRPCSRAQLQHHDLGTGSFKVVV